MKEPTKFYVWLVTKKAGKQLKELVYTAQHPHTHPKFLKNILLSERRMG